MLLDVYPELYFDNLLNLKSWHVDGAQLTMPNFTSGKVIPAISLTLNTNDITFVQ